MHFHIDYVPNAVVHRIGPFFKTWCAVCHAVASAVAREGGANVVSCISRFKPLCFVLTILQLGDRTLSPCL